MENKQMKKLKDLYIIKNGKKLKYGYTTGSCAAGAAKAACLMLFSQKEITQIELMTPNEVLLELNIKDIIINNEDVTCGIKKYAGDDPDQTDGIMIYATVKKIKMKSVNIKGGKGVGRITRAGLEQPVGEAAINKIPRKMIIQSVEEVCNQYDYEEGIEVEISIPEGEAVAEKTFNPRLGIVGGISVLGTTGLVVPMSEDALIASIKVEMQMKRANGKEYLIVVPGNYGENFLKEYRNDTGNNYVKSSNFIGEVVDLAVELKYKGILFIGHIGKLVKVAGGIMNTHSRNADCRMEIMLSNGIKAGLSLEGAHEMLRTVTTDDAITILEKEGIRDKSMEIILEQIEFYLDKRAYSQLETGCILFSNERGLLGKSSQADSLLKKIKLQEEENER